MLTQKEKIAGWTEEKIEYLKAQYRILPARKIGGFTGHTRCAVIGKAKRLGLSSVRFVEPKLTKKVRAADVEPAPIARTTISADFGVDSNIPLAQRKTIMELTRETCRWPVGNPRTINFFYCGAQIVNKSPYCAEHTKRSAPTNFHTPYQRKVSG